MKRYFKYRILCVAFAIVILILILMGKNSSVIRVDTEPEDKNNPNVKTILFWTGMFDSPSFEYGLGSDIFKDCPVSNCFATNDINYMPVEKFHAIMFHGYEFTRWWYGVPKRRSPKQVYIFLDMEPPIYNPDILRPFNNFYNWTMTFLSESDVQRKYGVFHTKIMNYTPPTVSQINSRKKRIAWFVSRCDAISKRDDLARKLSKYIDVDVYGKCGTFSCSRSDENHCYNLLETDYKYYLSFENSYCKDYVTEKLFHILEKNVVPIVYGYGDYESLAPPYSVIDVRDFDTIFDLAQYLTYLDQNPEEYLKYFEWKHHYHVQRGTHESLCNLCAKLNNPIEPKDYKNIEEWFRKDRCKVGKELPPIMFTD